MQKPISIKNDIYEGASGKESVFDLTIPPGWNGELILFVHGYMGYKDWGCWNLVSDFFVNENFGFAKYNLSHNGGTCENPIDFDDLDSFANNSYSKEIEDLEAIVSKIESLLDVKPKINLIGHSRGGGISLLQSKNEKVSKIISWAGISSIERRFPNGELLDQWKKDGVRYYKNGRTGQDMPHAYSQYEDFLENKDRLDIEAHCSLNKKPTLIIHGEKDASIKIDEGKKLELWLNTELVIIQNTQHTFDSSQPWKSPDMPGALKEACEITLEFLT